MTKRVERREGFDWMEREREREGERRERAGCWRGGRTNGSLDSPPSLEASRRAGQGRRADRAERGRSCTDYARELGRCRS
ncbi:hypothetical protein LY76DRAFT_594428 [Colletotrichum caudatum]|nr:hypothetical protein LY76DRAFT_594428 [Colletotrichum caudatum]